MADKSNHQQSHSTRKQPAIISLLRLPDVKRRTGLSRSSIYLAISQGKFPKSVNLGERSVAWSSADIDLCSTVIGKQERTSIIISNFSFTVGTIFCPLIPRKPA